VWLELEGRFVMGDGGLKLLEAIERLGSLAAAVQAMGWSYRHAWGYLRRAEAVLGVPLLTPRAGGAPPVVRSSPSTAIVCWPGPGLAANTGRAHQPSPHAPRLLRTPGAAGWW
jgi:hypothetical protein